jgi:hypothetical protein
MLPKNKREKYTLERFFNNNIFDGEQKEKHFQMPSRHFLSQL